MKNIINRLKEEGKKLFNSQLVAIKNSKSWGQLAPGISAVIVNDNFEGFLWSVEETTYNKFGGSNNWEVIYSAMFAEYTFRELNDKNINRLYLKENEVPTTINFGRRHGQDYKYVLTDNWGRPTQFRLMQIETEYIPLIYSLCSDLTIHQWDGKIIYRDIFVPKQTLYPYAEDNGLVLCCTHDSSLGFISAYWDGEMVYWKNNQKHLCGVSWCFLPKSKEELIDKINSKEKPIEEPTEEEYTSSNEEKIERKRRPRKN